MWFAVELGVVVGWSTRSKRCRGVCSDAAAGTQHHSVKQVSGEGEASAMSGGKEQATR